MSAGEDVNELRREFGRTKVVGDHEFRGERTIEVRLEALREILKHCRRRLGYELLLDVSSVDNAGEEPRFEVVYELATVDDAKHLRVKARVGEGEEVPSVAGVWATANWHEREVFDPSGIRFTGHPDLRRILCPEDWQGHPLRKDYQMPTEYHGIAAR